MEQRFSQVTYVARLAELKAAFPGTTPQRYFVTHSPWLPSTFRALGLPDFLDRPRPRG